MFSEHTNDQGNAEYGVSYLDNWSFWAHFFSAVHNTYLATNGVYGTPTASEFHLAARDMRSEVLNNTGMAELFSTWGIRHANLIAEGHTYETGESPEKQ